MNNTAELTYEENIPSDLERFASTVAEFNRAGIQYTTRRAHGLIVLSIIIGAH